MGAWRLKDAQEACETVFDRAYGGEPQIIMRDDKPMVVVVSFAAYRRMPEPQEQSRRSFVDALLSCPKFDAGDELDVERSQNDCGRAIDL